MGGWGKLWQVEDSARELLVDGRPKADWYKALGQLDLKNAPELDACGSIGFWSTALNEHPGSLGKLFRGEMRAAYDKYSDPNVIFMGRDLVAEVSCALNALNKSYFVDQFRNQSADWSREAWLYEPLRSFLSSASDNGRAVIIIWGH